MQEKSIGSFFGKIEDPRHHNKFHKLIDVITIAICGVIAGADTYEQIFLNDFFQCIDDMIQFRIG